MSKLVRVEVWYDADHLRAFPHVPISSITREDDFLMFIYGGSDRDEKVGVNLQKTFFWEIMDE